MKTTIKEECLSHLTTDSFAYAANISEGKNIVLVKEIMMNYFDSYWSQEECDKFTFQGFDNVGDVINSLPLEQSEEQMSNYLSNNDEINKDHIRLIYRNGYVLLEPLEPWELSDAERNLSKNDYFSLLERIADLFKA